MRYALALAFMLIATSVDAQHPPEHQKLHEEFYNNWLRPDIGRVNGERTQSCCSLHDCYPAEVKNVGGTWFFLHRESRRWLAIPERILEQNQTDPRESPDGHAHVCASATGNVFCAVLGVEI